MLGNTFSLKFIEQDNLDPLLNDLLNWVERRKYSQIDTDVKLSLKQEKTEVVATLKPKGRAKHKWLKNIPLEEMVYAE